MADITVKLDRKAIDDLKKDPKLGDVMLEIVKPLVRQARMHAPKMTGAGSQSIDAQKFREGGDEQTVRVSWARDNYYMIFHEQGTRLLPARPFLVPTFGGKR